MLAVTEGSCDTGVIRHAFGSVNQKQQALFAMITARVQASIYTQSLVRWVAKILVSLGLAMSYLWFPLFETMDSKLTRCIVYNHQLPMSSFHWHPPLPMQLTLAIFYVVVNFIEFFVMQRTQQRVIRKNIRGFIDRYLYDVLLRDGRFLLLFYWKTNTLRVGAYIFNHVGLEANYPEESSKIRMCELDLEYKGMGPQFRQQPVK